MNGTSLIHRFFDEGVSPDEEHILFSALAADPELRREFNQHLKISSFIKHDLSVTTPPAEVTGAVFTALGIPQYGTAETQSGGSAGRNGLLGALFQNMLPVIVTIGITAAVTAGYFILRVQEGAPVQSLTAEAPAMGGISADQPGTAVTPATTESSIDNAEYNINTRQPEHTGIQVPHLDATTRPVQPAPPSYTGDGNTDVQPTVAEEGLSAAMLRGTAVSEPVSIERQLLTSSTIAGFAPERYDDMSVIPEEVRNASFLSGMPAEQTPFTIANVLFQLRVIGVNKEFPSPGLSAPKQGLFKNMAVSGMYKLSENHAVGVQYGRESFGRVYSKLVPKSVKEGKDPLVTGTVPDPLVPDDAADAFMLDWGGAVWKMSLPNLSIWNLFYPYTEVFAGATKFGPTGRAMIGIELYPSNSSMINIGVEFTSMAYRVEQRWWATNKAGFSMGIAFTY